MTILEVIPQVIPGQSLLEKSVLGIMVLVMMAVTGFIYKQMSNAQDKRESSYLDDKKTQNEQHSKLMEVMTKKLDEAEKDRDSIYNAQLEHFKTTESALLQIIGKNTEAFEKFNESIIKFITIMNTKLK